MSLSSIIRLPASIDWAAWRPRVTVLWWVAGAFLAGLALFTWVTSEPRNAFRRPAMAPSTVGRDYVPLPMPSPADAQRTLAPEALEDDTRPHLEPSTPVQVETPTPRAAATPQPSLPRLDTRDVSPPQPMRTPAPRYPARALRNGDTGTVMVRAAIGVDGVPMSVSVEHSSGSRELDRAGMDAVRRWRFRPAMHGREPAEGSVVVPIEFRQ